MSGCTRAPPNKAHKFRGRSRAGIKPAQARLAASARALENRPNPPISGRNPCRIVIAAGAGWSIVAGEFERFRYGTTPSRLGLATTFRAATRGESDHGKSSVRRELVISLGYRGRARSLHSVRRGD